VIYFSYKSFKLFVSLQKKYLIKLKGSCFFFILTWLNLIKWVNCMKKLFYLVTNGIKIWGKHLIGKSTWPNYYSPCKILPSFHKLLFYIALLITRHLINLPSRCMSPCLTWISMNLFHFIIELLQCKQHLKRLNGSHFIVWLKAFYMHNIKVHVNYMCTCIAH